MTNQTMAPSDVTSDDKLWAALGYPIFIIAIIVLFMEDKKNRPFIKFHAIQALAVNVALWILILVLSVTVILALCSPLLWLVTLYFAYLAYQGKYFDLPVITNFIKSQGWDKV